MNEENTRRLLEDFPKLYRARECGLMSYGFECGDGWFDLIYKLSSDIELAAHEAGLELDSEQWPRASQVKQKFGTLRFYIRTPRLNTLETDYAPMPTGFIEMRQDSYIRKLIAEAEEKSAGICENCGLMHYGMECMSEKQDSTWSDTQGEQKCPN